MRISLPTFVVVVVFFAVPPVVWASPLADRIQQELCSDPALQKQQLKMHLVGENKGCLTLELVDGPKKLRDSFRRGLEIEGDGFNTGLKPDVKTALAALRKLVKRLKHREGVVEIALTGAMQPMDHAENYYTEAQERLAARNEDEQAGAISLLEKAAQMGFAPAQSDLAAAYHQGFVMPQNDRLAAEWCRKAAEQGDARSEFSFGRICAEGVGVDKNVGDAIKWYRKAADQEVDLNVKMKASVALAWFLATSPDESLRDGGAALEYAKWAYASAPSGPAVETLAVAYAQCGDFNKAVEHQKMWIQLLQQAKTFSSDDKKNLLAGAGKRLDYFQHGRAYIERD